MPNITQAVQALRDQIMDMGYTEGVVEEIAEEFEIKPELLRRKFTEVVGHEPQSWDAAALLSSRIKLARAEAGVMRRNFAPGAMRMRLEEGGEEVEIFGLPLRVPPRRLIVAIAVNDRDLIGIETGPATSGNPLVRVSIEKELGGREKLAEAFREALAREPRTNQG